MGTRKTDLSAPFQSIPNASRITGLSIYYLRKGCKEGTVPFIMCGTEYRIIIPKLMEQMGIGGIDEGVK